MIQLPKMALGIEKSFIQLTNTKKIRELTPKWHFACKKKKSMKLQALREQRIVF